MFEKTEIVKKRVEINLPTEETNKLQQDLVGELAKLLPDSDVEAIGAVAVPIAGRNEIDIMIVSDDILRDTEVLAQNGYRKGPIENGISYLKIYRDGVEIGVQIIPAGHKMIGTHRQIIAKLCADVDLRKRYEQFKLSLGGLSFDEYKQRKGEWIKDNLLADNKK